jgi:hypothetical protein
MVLVAIVLFSLLVFAALAVDTAAIVQERRTLQNSADAAALAVAQDCRESTCGDVMATAQRYTDANADDGTSGIEEICGTDPLVACADPPTLPEGTSHVRVTTVTRTPDGADEVPYTFARVMGLTGRTVRARATVAWGGPASLPGRLPITISMCEWDLYTNGGTEYVAPPQDPPSYTTYPPASAERVLYVRKHGGVEACQLGPSGTYLPGGFGWLDTDEACRTRTDIIEEHPGDTGISPPKDCTPAQFADLIDTVVHVPVFDELSDKGGSHAGYRMRGFAAFYLTGFYFAGRFTGGQRSVATGQVICRGDERCISGFFVDGQVITSPGDIGGPPMGVTVVTFVE